jgi:transcriptional regulator with XRE-family HTH domain
MSEGTVRPDGLRIKAARKAKKWTQQELADKTGYALSVIRKVETKKYFGLPCLEACVQALGEAYDQAVPRPQSRGEHQPLRGPTEFRGRARLRELYALGDDGQVRELTKRYYYGKIANATLTIRGTEADLVIDNIRMYDHPSCSKKYLRSSHCLQGHGLVVGDSVSIRYTVKDQTGRLSWAGVCVLSRPIIGPSHGYWMTAGHKERGSTVLGRLELELTSSEEADGHDQREG